jgi:hypothetical protein
MSQKFLTTHAQSRFIVFIQIEMKSIQPTASHKNAHVPETNESKPIMLIVIHEAKTYFYGSAHIFKGTCINYLSRMDVFGTRNEAAQSGPEKTSKLQIKRSNQ